MELAVLGVSPLGTVGVAGEDSLYPEFRAVLGGGNTGFPLLRDPCLMNLELPEDHPHLPVPAEGGSGAVLHPHFNLYKGDSGRYQLKIYFEVKNFG